MRQEAGSPATRPGTRLSRVNPCRGWLDVGASCETVGHWQGNSLQDRQGGTLKPCRRVTWPSVILDTNLATTPIRDVMSLPDAKKLLDEYCVVVLEREG